MPPPAVLRRHAWPWFAAALVALTALPLAGAFLPLPHSLAFAPVIAGVAAFILLARRGMRAAMPEADELWRSPDGK